MTNCYLHGILLSYILLMRVKVCLHISAPVVYLVCSVKVMSVLWNWFCFIRGVGLCVVPSGVVFQISDYKYRYAHAPFLCNVSILI
jgi:uncharacterized membrane protein